MFRQRLEEVVEVEPRAPTMVIEEDGEEQPDGQKDGEDQALVEAYGDEAGDVDENEHQLGRHQIDRDRADEIALLALERGRARGAIMTALERGRENGSAPARRAFEPRGARKQIGNASFVSLHG